MAREFTLHTRTRRNTLDVRFDIGHHFKEEQAPLLGAYIANAILDGAKTFVVEEHAPEKGEPRDVVNTFRITTENSATGNSIERIPSNMSTPRHRFNTTTNIARLVRLALQKGAERVIVENEDGNVPPGGFYSPSAANTVFSDTSSGAVVEEIRPSQKSSTHGEENRAATKFDSGKVQPSLIPVKAWREIAEVMTHGAEKYGARNYRGLNVVRVLDALKRHLLDFEERIDIDKDSGKSTLAHVGANVVMLMDMLTHPETSTDDR